MPDTGDLERWTGAPQAAAAASAHAATAMQPSSELAGRRSGRRLALEPEARDWARTLAPYRVPVLSRSLIELVITVVPLVALWLLMLLSLRHAYWISLILAVPAAGFLVRLFMIQHDCGHGSFFRSRRANDWLGRVLGVLTLTPYGYWRRTHAMHHATSGHLGRRGTGDLDTLTVREYQHLPAWRRALYRLTRHPIVLLGLAPPFVFVLKHRLPVRLMRAGWAPWISVMATNLAIAAVVGMLVALLGVRNFLLVQAPITLLASSAGIWLFYVQHQFEHTYWAWDADWNLHTCALHGSSHYDLPPVLRWFTANIGIHHVHHLSSRIPCYRLGEALRAHPELRGVSRLTLGDSFRCLRLALWDEDRQRLVSFREARRRQPDPGAIRSGRRPVQARGSITGHSATASAACGCEEGGRPSMNGEDVRAVEALIPSLRRFARVLVGGSVDLADDLVQETLEGSVDKFHQFAPETNLRAWLFAIMHNLRRSHYRPATTRKPEVPLEEAVGHASLYSTLGHALLIRDVKRAFSRLSEAHREVLALVIIEGMTYEQTAEILGIEVGTVRLRVSCARQSFRSEFELRDRPSHDVEAVAVSG